MLVSLIKRKTYEKYVEYIKIYPSRRAAFRAAKRDGNIPMGQQADEVIYSGTSLGGDYGLDDRNVRLYIFSIIIAAIKFEYHIREDKEAFYGEESGKGDQLPHFNSGEGGEEKKLKKHHFWYK